MKVTSIQVKFDNGGELNFNYPGGFDINDILDMLGLSTESLVDIEEGTWQHALNGLISIVIAALMKRFGL